MESTVYQRIKEYIEINHISLNALAKTLNMNQSTVLRQVKGEQTLSSNLVESFLTAYPDVSAEWLMRGVGNMEICKYALPEEDSVGLGMVAEPILDHREVGVTSNESIWKAKYEAIKDCYDMLVSSLGGVIGKRNVG